MNKQLLLLGAGLVLAGCHRRQEDTPAPAKDFTVGYYFTNEGDANVDAVALTTRTTYPKEQSLQMFDNIYERITPYQKIAHLFTAPHMKKTLYPGCTTYMIVRLVFRKPVYTPYKAMLIYNIPSNGYLVRVFELPRDTVTEAANCTRSFNWPSDTLKYKELQWYY